MASMTGLIRAPAQDCGQLLGQPLKGQIVGHMPYSLSPPGDRLPSSIGLCLGYGRSSGEATGHSAFLSPVAPVIWRMLGFMCALDRQDRSQFLRRCHPPLPLPNHNIAKMAQSSSPKKEVGSWHWEFPPNRVALCQGKEL